MFGVWTCGDDVALIFRGGDVVFDYAFRIKDEFAGDRLWIEDRAVLGLARLELDTLVERGDQLHVTKFRRTRSPACDDFSG